MLREYEKAKKNMLNQDMDSRLMASGDNLMNDGSSNGGSARKIVTQI